MMTEPMKGTQGEIFLNHTLSPPSSILDFSPVCVTLCFMPKDLRRKFKSAFIFFSSDILPFDLFFFFWPCVVFFLLTDIQCNGNSHSAEETKPQMYTDVQKCRFLNSTSSGLSVSSFKELAGILSAIHLFLEA